MPRSGSSNPSVAGLTQEQIKPESVTKIEVKFSGRAAFTSMKLCKGAGSLVGDPHVRTQDHAHYTVLNDGNFLAWRFNSDARGRWEVWPQGGGLEHLRPLLGASSLLGPAACYWWISPWDLGIIAWSSPLRSASFGSVWVMSGESWSLPRWLEVSEGGHFVTGFNFTHLENGSIHFESKNIWTPKGNKARWDAEFLMATPRGKQRIAAVQLRCFPGRPH